MSAGDDARRARTAGEIPDLLERLENMTAELAAANATIEAAKDDAIACERSAAEGLEQLQIAQNEVEELKVQLRIAEQNRTGWFRNSNHWMGRARIAESCIQDIDKLTTEVIDK